MRALYDLSKRIASFNFFEWLVQVKTLGATEVVFDIRRIRAKKWPADITLKRFCSICEPGPALAGLPYEVISGSDLTASSRASDIARPGGPEFFEFYKTHKNFERLRGVLPPGNARYTVTLRNTQRSPHRNSDEAVWREFAKRIGALVIEDYETVPLHLHQRFALYEGAEMNFFVTNGPLVLAQFSTIPYMAFDLQVEHKQVAAAGAEVGKIYPWALKDQYFVWEQPTMDVLCREFENWHKRR